MNSKALFLAGCVPTRLILAVLIARASSALLKPIAIVTAIIAIGFLTLFLTGWRKTGVETGGKPIWWNSLRPVHAGMYAAVAFCAWTGRRELAWKLVCLDLVVGLLAFTAHYSNVKKGM